MHSPNTSTFSIELTPNTSTWAARVHGRRLRVRASEVAVVNASTIGFQALRWSPDIKVDDGQLELCLLRAVTVVDLVRVFVHALLGRQRFEPTLRIIPITGGRDDRGTARYAHSGRR